MGLPVEQLSETAAAARRANEAWRFKPRRSQFRGVVWDQKAAHWRVEVRAPGGETRINCGTWDDEADAGRAYDRDAKNFVGKELNFDGSAGPGGIIHFNGDFRSVGGRFGSVTLRSVHLHV